MKVNMKTKKEKVLDHYSKCPECDASWDGGDIPEANRKYYAPPYKWSRLIGIEILHKYDGVSFWQCPDCPARWDRWTGKLVISGKRNRKKVSCKK